MIAAFVILVIRPLGRGRFGGPAAQHDPDELRHDDAVEGAPPRVAPARRLVRKRLRGPHRQPDHAGAPAAGDAVFQVFDMAAFAAATFLGALLMLAEADPRLMIPLLLWLVAYLALMRWTIRRAGPPPRPPPTRAAPSPAASWTATPTSTR